MEQKMYLLLENGIWFEGKSFGACPEEVVGEVVFTTSMTGYLETITDPSYYGQIVVQTFPLIGNYGVIPSDFESAGPHLSAYIVREWCQSPSNFRSEGDLDTFFKEKNLPALSGIDTRRLTKIIRENGVMNGKLTKKAPPYSEEELKALKAYRVEKAVTHAARRNTEYFPAETEKFQVVLWDFGAKQNIIRKLNQYGCSVTAVPARTTAREILNLQPDGVMLSNGPGDPQENEEIIAQLKKLCAAKIPMFGICLGHQLLALANGAHTKKLKYGHRGANQPVINLDTGRVYITSQNHGYTVDKESLPESAVIHFVNGNDGTCEGIRYTDIPAFSVQFHPEACGGPKDTEWLFEKFIDMMEERED